MRLYTAHHSQVDDHMYASTTVVDLLLDNGPLGCLGTATRTRAAPRIHRRDDIHVAEESWRIAAIPKDRPIVITCTCLPNTQCMRYQVVDLMIDRYPQMQYIGELALEPGTQWLPLEY